MSQLFAIALGGACGALIRFMVSTGIYHWLGRGFPYGTLAVNIFGSFLLGLLTEALVLHRVGFTVEYRAAILIGFIGAFTTFSTFSLETVLLLQQDQLNKALLNVFASVTCCLFAVWLGLLLGKALSVGSWHWSAGLFPYALVSVNAIGAFLMGLILQLLLSKIQLVPEQQLLLLIVTIGAYLLFSGFYVLLSLLEQGHHINTHAFSLIINFTGNSLICLLFISLGIIGAKQL